MATLNRADFRPASEWISKLPEASQAKVRAGAAEIVEEAHLAAVRKAMTVTQTTLAERTGLKQAEISRIENNIQTVQMKTLQRYVSGLGGTMKIVAEFPDGTHAEIPVRSGKPVKSGIKIEAAPDMPLRNRA
jgi:DNA-binding XRE family transcriptional regulator